MATPKWLGVTALLALSACFTPAREPDCLLEGTCECKRTADCPEGKACVDGRCFEVPDAGRPGALGWPCADDAECLFGPCLPLGPGNGRVCSAACGPTDAGGGEACALGWQCKQSLTTAGFVCTPPLAAQCLRCETDLDCNAAGDRCLAVGEGRFCTTDCALGDACPGGSSCRSVRLDAGVARQCVPDTETCECSAVSAGLQRACRRTNARATCFGAETCLPTGAWSGCDAREASEELCDGLDNDCDGLTDQADPDLRTTGLPGFPACTKGTSCTGAWSCGSVGDAGFGFQCSAPDPQEERCNGADDDCDGQVDEGLLDSSGAYVSPRACGSCATDCFEVLQHLARDGGAVVEGAATCELRSGQRTCVPLQCEKGFFPSPPGAPQRCEPALSSQCRPCATAADCQVPGDQCVTVGTDPARACAQSCEPSSPYPGCTGQVGARDCCPVDATCQLVGGKKQCVPLGGSCQCTAERAGFSRSCFVSAAGATCIGAQVCEASGAFGACDTSQTSMEFCDGRDNDCDGEVDDGFVGTQGTGTWDTDEHCGACNNNCVARWSPTIQHAIGGCVAGPLAAPTCRIVACTTERVPGGGACRLDSECAAGFTCHPTFRQCTRACASGMGCGAGEVCEAGSCTRPCTSTTDCVATWGPGAACSNGTCAVTYPFVNADRDETNGCECPSNPVLADEPELYPSYPTPGLPYVDRDCDQVDGAEKRSLFVWARSPSSRGTRAAPFRTIAEALAAFRPGTHGAILVAQGTYVEQVVLTSGAALYGGYSADFTRRDVVLFPTFIEAAEPRASAPRGTVNAEGLTGRTVLAGFTVRGYDVISRPLPGQPGRNSYAVYAANSPGLVVQNNHLVGGRGGDGAPALPGVAGANGGTGLDGVPARECNSPECLGETQPGGAAGSNPACAGGTQGRPGAGSDLRLNPQAYSPGGLDGRGGSNALYNHSDPSQAAYCKYDCTVPEAGLAGGAAQNGGDGAASAPGAGCGVPLGAVVNGEWTTAAGGVGAVGSPGRGGGGGGAGGCVSNANPPTCTVGRRVGDLGGTGGGGGAGGCGGGRGAGAGGGGASFALFVEGALPTIEGNLIDLGFGGTGGNGGAGGYGGLGGQGGRGGPNTTVAWCAGQGGPGGRGGNGGAGSGGGGGCGGSVFGVAGRGLPVAQVTARNTLAPPPLNAVGAGGLGGASPAGATFKGGDGAAGVVVPVQSF